MAKPVKTNAMRLLERGGVPYEPVYYDLGDAVFSGEAVSALTGIPPERSFKTLCARSAKGAVLVFVVPVSVELDLKAAASAAGEKRVELVAVAELPGLTGYLRGSVTPVGMKKPYPVFIDHSALSFGTIGISAGAKGATVLVDPQALVDFLQATVAKLT